MMSWSAGSAKKQQVFQVHTESATGSAALSAQQGQLEQAQEERGVVINAVANAASIATYDPITGRSAVSSGRPGDRERHPPSTVGAIVDVLL